jgi:hypothetical protein
VGEERTEARSWLGDALARRTRHPTLEGTLFNRLHELEQGPLEQLSELVHLVVDELRVAQRRLSEQSGDLRALQRTVATLNDRVDRLSEPTPAPEPVEGHVLLLTGAEAYRLAGREGPPPAPGDRLEEGGRSYRILGGGASPLPGDRRRCVLALPD